MCVGGGHGCGWGLCDQGDVNRFRTETRVAGDRELISVPQFPQLKARDSRTQDGSWEDEMRRCREALARRPGAPAAPYAGASFVPDPPGPRAWPRRSGLLQRKLRSSPPGSRLQGFVAQAGPSAAPSTSLPSGQRAADPCHVVAGDGSLAASWEVGGEARPWFPGAAVWSPGRSSGGCCTPAPRGQGGGQ